MKINFPLLETAIEIERPTIFVVEDTKVFSNLIKDFYQYGETSNQLKIFEKTQRSLLVSELMVITDILSFDMNSSSILKLIYQELAEHLNDDPEKKSNIEYYLNHIHDCLINDSIEYDLDLIMEEPEIQDVYKFFKLKVNSMQSSIFETTLEIIDLYKKLKKKKLLVLINSCSYYSQEELQELISYISLQNSPVLMIEPRRIEGVEQIVLDNDFYLTN
ncbi:type II-A CRISPR-associated protein Csn2 [Vagococcus zengguangii]|uniref:Type II-A CRISPR-associated protein Csn2 n=1 Tax=Vagococcus zengguangii TaxID=2571750 RepID=A0A4D7CSN3_9ENTE|nr:type II-A CRISPR-associated protein Csn2 [Vagococcus zengguangii]QCI87199.1 type II-A CRISPR-associated protein Csn2 [Vagococcus zengguangii]TLG80703.1 type II-A CRISPR-associated protein Csn2 [Vagococcus zengguangii]